MTPFHEKADSPARRHQNPPPSNQPFEDPLGGESLQETSGILRSRNLFSGFNQGFATGGRLPKRPSEGSFPPSSHALFSLDSPRRFLAVFEARQSLSNPSKKDSVLGSRSRILSGTRALSLTITTRRILDFVGLSALGVRGRPDPIDSPPDAPFGAPGHSWGS